MPAGSGPLITDTAHLPRTIATLIAHSIDVEGKSGGIGLDFSVHADIRGKTLNIESPAPEISHSEAGLPGRQFSARMEFGGELQLAAAANRAVLVPHATGIATAPITMNFFTSKLLRWCVFTDR